VVTVQTTETGLAWDMVMNRHPISPRVGVHFWPDRLNIPSHLMPEYGRRHPHAVKFLQIRSADSACSDLDENLSWTNPWRVKIG